MHGASFDFLSQTESSGVAADAMDGEGWGLTPPRLQRDSSDSHVPRAGNVAAPCMDLGNLDLNADCGTALYPDMTMYTHILHRDIGSGQGFPPQRARSAGLPLRGRRSRQGLSIARAPAARGKAVVVSGGGDAAAMRVGARRGGSNGVGSSR
ncbi:hypothetical protein ZWY2020_015627 [Hordeum vulgare]|nr:hypothetical protein ZWY2020_005658 [Hordeum vulgare]KAI4978874.1 hypothetical protein ZWY2020_015627 [Hordeum vulgare]